MREHLDLWIEPDPSKEDCHHEWNIVRTPPDRRLDLVLVSRDLLGVRTHYFRGRTTPCRRADCPACATGMLSRWTGYVLALEWSKHIPSIFEFTPGCVETLRNIQGTHGTLRMAKISASRASHRANGKVVITYKGQLPDGGVPSIPEDEPLLPLLLKIWGLSEAAGVPSSSAKDSEMSEAERVTARRAKKTRGPKAPIFREPITREMFAMPDGDQANGEAIQ